MKEARAKEDERDGVDTSAYARSEVTRLLCAAVYLDSRFRRDVIRKFAEPPERVAAPSLGFDVVPVLRHSLRARSLETKTALWVIAGVPALGLLTFYMMKLSEDLGPGSLARAAEWFGVGVSAGLSVFPYFGALTLLSRFLTGRSTAVYLHDKGEKRRNKGILAVLGHLIPVAMWAYVAFSLLVYYIWLSFFAEERLTSEMWAGGLGILSVFMIFTWIAAWHRAWVEHILATELSEQSFTGEGPEVNAKYGPLFEMISREQHSGVIIYDTDDPFLGAGDAYKVWSFPLELRTKSGESPGDRLSGRFIIDLVRRELETLKGSISEFNLDRLRQMEITECVFLPGPLPAGYGRSQLPTERDDVPRQVAEAVDEGAEQRRHFLRVRIGGWEEQVVTTVFVRAHPQGGTLLLEVAPHVLTPLRDEFFIAEMIAETNPRAATEVVRLFWAFVNAPAASLSSCFSLFQTVSSELRTRGRDSDGSRVEPPLASIREQAASHELSLFQEMDVARYVKTVQERMAKGVHKALAEAGYATDEFQQGIVNINSGGVFIGGSMSGGAIATGQGAQAGHDERAFARKPDSN